MISKFFLKKLAPKKRVKKASFEDVAVTLQSSLDGQTGKIIKIVVAECVFDLSKKNLFFGLSRVLKKKPIRGVTDIELVTEKVMTQLQKEAYSLGADAIIDFDLQTTRGINEAGVRQMRVTGMGAAVKINKGDNSEV